ncbi:hypothetical protein C9E82_18170 [Paracoccus siganidrum]|uniref:Uncharacterized protein n=1 Tax=Paracoccus siganidrum TaxID=1276757 RepID=A0A419A851_9RHOB|nr:hypothetical protein D3P05_07985 [Paracoccus siganidrum]RMC30269.1 hypothetical protein C9E82_18170 [Paracoccus siganidrum]
MLRAAITAKTIARSTSGSRYPSTVPSASAQRFGDIIMTTLTIEVNSSPTTSVSRIISISAPTHSALLSTSSVMSSPI